MIPENAEEDSPGIFGSLRRIVDTVLAIVQNRLELVSVELREEKASAVSLLIWCGLLTALVSVGAITLTFLVVVVFWKHAVTVLAVFSAIYFTGAILVVLTIRRKLKSPIFAETLKQLKKDRAWLLTRK